jgi:hypothetical protein
MASLATLNPSHPMNHNVVISTFEFNLIAAAAQSNPSLASVLASLRQQIHAKPYFFGSVPEDEDELRDFEEGRDDEPRDDMDGDFDSAMASAGHGTDEDYGYFGEMGMNED